jgi:hypothetical protein
MKSIVASIFVAGLLATSAAQAGIGVHVGPIGMHVGGHHHHHGCRNWGWHHHNRYCRGYW